MLKAFNLLISFKRFTTFTQAKKMNSKATIVVKPTQSGKTFTMLTKIVDLFRENEETSTRRIQLIFVDNNLLLANQTASRVRDCEWFENDQNEYLMFSSNSRTAKAGDIIRHILSPFRDRQVHNIIMCANIYRFRDTIEIIGCTSGIEYDIWIDESDKTFSSANHTTLMKTFCDMPNVKSITLLTATPSKNLKQFKDGIPIYAMESTTLDIYTSWSDSTICHHDIDLNDAVSYARSVLDRFPENFKGNVKCFIPADFYVETHETMASMLIDRGFTVLIINGSTCAITYKLGRNIIRYDVLYILKGLNPVKYADGLDNIPASDWIADIYTDISGPFAITGNLCINRGTTLSSSKMCINRAIMPPKQPKNKNDKEVSMTRMYQLAGRICGNTMEFSDWQAPIVFCTSVFDTCIQIMETRAKRLAEVAFENGKNIVNSDDYETIAEAPKTKAELNKEAELADMELRGTVPTILDIHPDNYKLLTERIGSSNHYKLSSTTRQAIILGELHRQFPIIHKDILKCICKRIIVPGTEDTINRLIEIPLIKNANGIKWKAVIDKTDCENNVWAAFIDPNQPRVVICAYFGRRCHLIEDI